MDERDTNGWDQYQKLVLSELTRFSDGMTRLEEGIAGLQKQVAQLHTKVAVLTVKSGVWGFAAGALPVVAFILINYLLKR